MIFIQEKTAVIAAMKGDLKEKVPNCEEEFNFSFINKNLFVLEYKYQLVVLSRSWAELGAHDSLTPFQGQQNCRLSHHRLIKLHCDSKGKLVSNVSALLSRYRLLYSACRKCRKPSSGCLFYDKCGTLSLFRLPPGLRAWPHSSPTLTWILKILAYLDCNIVRF